MQKTQCTLLIFIQEVRYNILILLCSLHWIKDLAKTIWFRLLFIIAISAFLWFKIDVNIHKPCYSTDVGVPKPGYQIRQSIIIGGGPDIQQNTKFRFEISAKSLEKPEVRRKLRSVSMLKARKYS